MLLGHVISIGVRSDGSVAIDAPPHEISHEPVRNVDRPKGETLRRREPDTEEPVVEAAITPLHSVIQPSGPMSALRDRSAESKTSAHRLDLIEIFGDQGHLPFLPRKISVGRHQPDRIRDLRTPADVTRIHSAEWDRPDRNGEPSKPAEDCRGRATEPRGDLIDREPLINIKPSQQLSVNGHVGRRFPPLPRPARRLHTSSVAPPAAPSMPQIRYTRSGSAPPRGLEGDSPARRAPILR